jgi:branched-chain amino acid transport system ATP-binding protein
MSTLTAIDLCKRFDGVVAVANVSLTVEAGERRLLIGPNGAGKTTLFNMLSGTFAASSGSVVLFDRDITLLPAYARARLGLARTFQITNLFPRLTVRENILLALQAGDPAAFSLGRRMRANRNLFAAAEKLLQDWGLVAIADKLTREIAYGEQRQIDVLLAMAMQPKVLLLDEPTAGLSAAEVVRVVGMIRSLPREVTIVMIEHDMDVAFEVADRISVLHQGRLIAEGDGEAIRNHPQVREIYLGLDEPRNAQASAMAGTRRC